MGRFSHSFELQTSEIIIDRETRQRRVIETDDLETSIRQRGLINPIIVERANGAWKLVAGERRLTACQKLGLPVVAREVSDLSPIEHQLIELEENIKRQDLEWQEIAKAIGRVHQIHISADSEWTMGETADSIGLSLGQVSMYLRVNAELASNQRVAEAGTAREAYNVIARRDHRAANQALEELITPTPEPPRPLRQVEVPIGPNLDIKPQPLPAVPPAPPGPPSPEETILQQSFLEWAESYSGPKFNFIHCDFPYGIDFAAGPQGRGNETTVYDDGKDVYFALLQALLDNRDKLLTLNSHIMFWYSEKHGEVTRHMFSDAGFKVLRYPLIWVKTDGAGIASDSRRTPRHIYETALLIVRGDRQLVRVKADAYSAPTDKKLHPSTKPLPVLKHFFEMLVDDSTTMLDPTCGSGSALRAAEHFGAATTLGLEIDPQYIGPARIALKNARTLKGAERLGL